MGWPTPQEYNEAIQNTHLCFLDEELQSGQIALNNLGLPKAITGSFASVYSVKCADKNYAVRCLLHDIPDQQLRYQRLSRSICNDTLEYTIDFEYQERGIRVGNGIFPIIKMQWINGLNLDSYVRTKLGKKTVLQKLQAQFRQMIRSLAAENFAHGDLQHGNIIIADEGLRLVDYDGMFVPSLSGMLSNEIGHRNYQHPARSKEHFGVFLDNFSAWVIDVSLTCLIEDPALASLVPAGNEALLFLSSDFKDPISSDTFIKLESHSSNIIRQSSRMLRTVLGCLPYNVPALSDQIPEADEHPRVIELTKRAKVFAEFAESADQMYRESREKFKQSQAERAAKSKEKPGWLDEETAASLSRVEPAPRIKSQNNAPQQAAAEKASNTGVSLSDCLEAVKDPSNNLSAGFASYRLLVSPDGGVNHGSNSAVFRLQGPIGLDIALKIITQSDSNTELEIEKFNKFIDDLRPPQIQSVFIKQELVKEALYANRQWLPALKSNWIDGSVRLDNFLIDTKPDFDYSLLTSFRKTMRALRIAGIVHGNLEPTNIIVLPDNKIAFADYANLSLNSSFLFNNQKLVNQDYRHPLFTTVDSPSTWDSFQAWLIDTLLMCWSISPKFWRANADRSRSLLFKSQDFNSPEKSDLIQGMLEHPQYELSERAQFLMKVCKISPTNIPPLSLDGVAIV